MRSKYRSTVADDKRKGQKCVSEEGVNGRGGGKSKATAGSFMKRGLKANLRKD